jgi:hypothetical protein
VPQSVAQFAALIDSGNTRRRFRTRRKFFSTPGPIGNIDSYPNLLGPNAHHRDSLANRDHPFDFQLAALEGSKQHQTASRFCPAGFRCPIDN